MAKAVGLDVGSRTVKLVELDGSPKKYRVTKYVAREIPGEGGAAEGQIVAETIGEVLKEARAHGDSLIVAMDSKSVVIREITVPFLQDDQIRRVLRFEAEAHLHNYAIEDVIVDYLKIGEAGDQARILILAAPKDRVRERLAMVQVHGVDPMHMDLDMAALFNAAKASGALEDHPDSVILDMGAATTNILFVRDGRLKSFRSLRSGSESISRVLSQDLAVDTDSARRRAEEGDRSAREDDLLAPIPLEVEREGVPETEKSAGELERAIVMRHQDDFVGRIFRETSRSIATQAGGESVSAIFLTGGASLAGGVERRLEQRFGKPVIRLDYLGGNGHAVPAAEHDRANSGMGVALGCALRGLGGGDLSLEFRREELRYTRKFDLIKVALASTVSLIFILLFLTWLNYQNTLRTRESELNNILSRLQSQYVTPARKQFEDTLKEFPDRFPEDPTDKLESLRVWDRQLQMMHKHITSDLGINVQGIPPIRSALRVWKDVFDKLEGRRRELGYFFLDEIKITQKTVTFKGEVGNVTRTDLIKNELLKIDYVEKAILGAVTTNKEGKVEFSMTLDLAETTSEGRP